MEATERQKHIEVMEKLFHHFDQLRDLPDFPEDLSDQREEINKSISSAKEIVRVLMIAMQADLSDLYINLIKEITITLSRGAVEIDALVTMMQMKRHLRDSGVEKEIIKKIEEMKKAVALNEKEGATIQ